MKASQLIEAWLNFSIWLLSSSRIEALEQANTSRISGVKWGNLTFNMATAEQ
jgi:hypothetical protein